MEKKKEVNELKGMKIDFTKVPIKGIDGNITSINITDIPEQTQEQIENNVPARSILQQFASYIGMNTPDLGELDIARKIFANNTNEYSNEEVNTMKRYVDKFFVAAWLREGINKLLK